MIKIVNSNSSNFEFAPRAIFAVGVAVVNDESTIDRSFEISMASFTAFLVQK